MKTSSSTQTTAVTAPDISFIDKNARSLVHKLLSRIHSDTITLKEGRQEFVFGQGTDLQVTLRVHHPGFYRQLLFGGSIGAGESYVDGHWDTDNLTVLVRIMSRNREVLSQLEGKFALISRPLQRIRHLLRANNRSGAKKNILSHYDLGNDMYRSFLDPTMMYSAAIYPNTTSTLEEAAVFKLDHICRKLKLGPGDRVVEIGSGWGGFALHAAKNYGCHVTTTTISDAQYEEARGRIADAGLGDRITLLKQDYRDLSGKFDKLVSIEMIEAVGYDYLPLFFKKCADLLKPDGTMLLQAITIRDQQFQSYRRSVDFIQRHIFPGGCIVSNEVILKFLSEQTDLVVQHLEDIGHHYARTLRDWRERFLGSFHMLEKSGYDQRFKRLWDFYFSYCEGGFRERAISTVQVIASRPHSRQRVDIRPCE